jgi:D-3-phosphoglycerate dehydrogenase
VILRTHSPHLGLVSLKACHNGGTGGSIEVRMKKVMETKATVLMTDHPWADVDIERGLIEGAGYRLVTGGVQAGSPAEIESLVKDYDPVAILTCWAPVSERAIGIPSHLAIVARIGVGLDNIVVAAASRRGAWVTNVPDYCIAEVSDHALALLLAAVRGVAMLDRDVKSRGWHVPALVPRRLSELVVGVIGYGRIGRETVRKLRVFGCRVLVSDPVARDVEEGAEHVELRTLQQHSDAIILHAPLNEQTLGMVGESFLAACKKHPILVNVSRGGLIENNALTAALDSGTLRCAALDVVEGEPLPPLAVISRDDVIVTPHIGYLSDASLRELRQRACEEVARVLQGKPPKNPCNAPECVPSAGARLTGGVSSDIRIVVTAHGPIVVKRALERLNVTAVWRSDPSRAMTEARALKVAAELLGPDKVPAVLWERPETHTFGMTRIDPALRNWKAELLLGQVDMATARAAGALLGALHSRAAARPELAREFADTTNFYELRVAPFFEHVGERLPDLADPIARVVEAMTARRSTLVHGDYSPKNMLVQADRLVILDFEVAHWGDPTFDVAFCLSHLMLKGMRRAADRGAFHAAIVAFLHAYTVASGPHIDNRHLARLLACLLLARTDGDSPVEYLDSLDIDAARATARALLLDPPASLYSVLAPVSS